ncbi:SRPBCC domain-containing protein [Streptomyces sp. NPDC089919]|uniref:SRPBCC domain-containing protein n=1 Tax=Streptomyces sp. NPDC089919 TaxID=3155188 RepID=UPI003447122D
MRAITTETVIPAPASEVWAALTDLDRYHEWNPFIREASGTVAVGSRLQLVMYAENGRATTFRPAVLTAEEGRELRWLGRFLVPGLFDGEHYFHLEPTPDGGTRVIHGEDFRGLLVPFLGKLLEGTRRNFEAMNDALAARVAGRAAASRP